MKLERPNPNEKRKLEEQISNTANSNDKVWWGN